MNVYDMTEYFDNRYQILRGMGFDIRNRTSTKDEFDNKLKQYKPSSTYCMSDDGISLCVIIENRTIDHIWYMDDSTHLHDVMKQANRLLNSINRKLS